MPAALDLLDLLESWTVHLRAERRSPETIRSYRTGVQKFVAWCTQTDRPTVLDRPTVNGWIADLLDAGAEGATAQNRQHAVRRMSAWLLDEDYIARDELVGLKPPQRDRKITHRLTDEELTAMIRTCSGKDFGSRRDEAIIRLMFETASRAGEIVAMSVEDVDIIRGVAMIRKGKGGKGRTIPFGPHTARAIDRYLRLRRSHRLADTPKLWLGVRGRDFKYHGLYEALKRRARDAGIENFHPHLTRHTAAQRWLSAGGSEGSLMAVAGWSRREMLDRYTHATAAERAAVEARRLNLGDL